MKNYRKFAIGLLATAAFVLSAAAQDVISTAVGGGPNNLPGTTANLYQPFTEAIDASGNIYVASYQQNRVFKISTSGVVTVVAGNGIAGYSGDGGLAVNAELSGPYGVAVDTASPAHVYISDSNNCLIRKVSPSTGIITTVAGDVTSPTSSTCGYSGNSGPATDAELNRPYGLAVNSGGSIYFADFYNGVIRKVSGSTGDISVVAGGGGSTTSGNNCGGSSPYGNGGAATSGYLCYPNSVSLDSSGNLFVSESASGGRCDIREVVAANSDIYQLAGNFTCGFVDGVTATSGELYNPWQTWISVSGATTTVTVADYQNYRIRQFTLTYSSNVPHPGTITTIGGDGSPSYCGDGGPVTSACLGPVGIVYDSSGNYYVGDYYNDRVRKVTKSSGDISTILGWGPNGGTQVNYSDPVGVTNVAGGQPSLYYPVGVYADPTSDNVYIGGYDGESVYKWNSGTTDLSGFAGNGVAGFEGDGGAADSTATELNNPWGIARDGSGNIYIGDYNNCDIREVSESTGDITTIAGGSSGSRLGCGYTADGETAVNTQNDGVSSIVVVSSGSIYYADYGECVVRKIAAGTNVVSTIAGDHTLGCGYSGDLGPASHAQIRNPAQIAMDSEENLYIADYGNCRVREVVHATGIIKTIAGDGSCGYTGDGVAISNAINNAQGVWSDPNGNVFISDTNNQILRWVTPTGQLTTFAGTPDSAGFVGDGGPALSAKLYYPEQITQDSSGHIYVADEYNFRVRKVTPFAGFGLSTASLNFETQPAGTTSDFQPVTVSAVGPITISGVTASANFSEVDDCAGTALTAGETCEIDVYFNPAAAGQVGGTITLTSNAKFSTQLNTVSLTGTASGLTLSGSLAFGTTLLKTPVSKTVTLKNSGAAITLDKIYVTDTTDYSITGGTCPTGAGSLGAGASCTITVAFSPTTIGAKKCTLVVESSDPASPLLAAMTGTGTEAEATPTSLAFGTITHGTTSTLDVTVKNVGPNSMTLSNAISGTGAADFTVRGTGTTCTSSLAAGASCTLAVEFEPAAAEAYSATLTVTTNGGSNPTVALSGTGD